mgnify:CR=1 FL=1
MVASAINDELTASGVVDGITVGVRPLEQIVTVGTPPSADPEEVEAARVIAADVIDREAQRIAADRPETVDIEEPWSVSVLRLMTVTAANANDAPIG